MRKSISKQAAIVSFRSLFSESDKGCVLIIASILEETLRQLHEAHIAVITYPSKKNVFKDLSNAQLSTFAGMIQIANAYGLISDEDYKDLQLIRKLRNEAAHCIFDFNLQDSGVKAIVMQLSADERAERMFAELEKKSSNAKPALNLPKLTEARSHLILNGLALHDIIVAKLADAIERLLAKRKTVSR